MTYEDLTKELKAVFDAATPDGTFTDNLKMDLIASMGNLSVEKALAMATCLVNAAKELRDVASSAFLQSLDNFNPTTGEKYNEGKNFTSDGLVFRVNTKADYNYQANDDVAAEYGMTLQALQNIKKGYDEQSKLHTRLIKVRKELILTAHPRMQPIAGTVKHSVSFQGTETEVLRRNANIDFQDE